VEAIQDLILITCRLHLMFPWKIMCFNR